MLGVYIYIYADICVFNIIFRYWWARLNVLAKQENWKKLEEFSKVKKSPIGYEVNRLNLCSAVFLL